MDKDDRRVIIKLHDRIKKHQSLNNAMWVSDWRTASSHRWHGVGMAELARRLGLTIYQLESFMLYMNWHNFMEELADKYRDELANYQSDIDIDNVLSWALALLADDYELRDHRLYNIEA